MKKLFLILALLFPITSIAQELPGGGTPKTYISTGTDEDATIIATGRRRVYCFDFINNDLTDVAYLKIYDSLTLPDETLTPKYVKPILPGRGAANFCLPFNAPLIVTNGLTFRITTASANNSVAAVGAGDVVGTFIYK